MKTVTAVLSREEDMYMAMCPEAHTVQRQGRRIEEAVSTPEGTQPSHV
ncbi:MAG: hypothetical protein ACP5C4_00945 [Methanomicrobiales archaeon]